jgi:hypothetical protein
MGRTGARVDPHLALAIGAAIVVAAEAGYRTWTSDVWLFLEAAVAAGALLYAWREQARLRLLPLLVVTLAFQVSIVVVHLALDVAADIDSRLVFRWQGNGLLRGDYPRSEYPVGAVALFGLEAWLGGGTTRVANAFAMVPFHLAAVAGLWALRTRFAPWLAALVALWPLNTFSWEFKYDLAPTAFLVLGLLAAYRQRWPLAGVLLAVGALLKWTPGLAFLALLVWLVASRRGRDAVAHALAFVGTVAIVYVPVLLSAWSDAIAAYTRQGGRRISPESFWYLFLRPLGLAEVVDHISRPAGAPQWANVGAAAVQLVLVALLLLAALRLAGDLRTGVAVAALVPCVFLLTNRIFSPQFLVTLLAAWALAAALLVRNPLEQLAVGAAGAGASLANAFVYPFALPYYDFTWPICSAVLFALGLGVSGWLVRLALLRSAEATELHPRPALSAGSAPRAAPRPP